MSKSEWEWLSHFAKKTVFRRLITSSEPTCSSTWWACKHWSIGIVPAGYATTGKGPWPKNHHGPYRRWIGSTRTLAGLKGCYLCPVRLLPRGDLLPSILYKREHHTVSTRHGSSCKLHKLGLTLLRLTWNHLTSASSRPFTSSLFIPSPSFPFALLTPPIWLYLPLQSFTHWSCFPIEIWLTKVMHKCSWCSQCNK